MKSSLASNTEVFMTHTQLFEILRDRVKQRVFKNARTEVRVLMRETVDYHVHDQVGVWATIASETERQIRAQIVSQL